MRNPLLLSSGFCALILAVTSLWAADAETSMVIERGLHHRVVRTESGGSYTVLADGLCYEDNGVLKDSEEVFELEPGFAVARRGQHKATLAANINSERVVELIAPDGKRFVSRIAGLSYFSAATGENILIAQVQDSIGVLHPPNQIIYPAALVGDGVTADVRYTRCFTCKELLKKGQQRKIAHEMVPFGNSCLNLDLADWRSVLLSIFRLRIEKLPCGRGA